MLHHSNPRHHDLIQSLIPNIPTHNFQRPPLLYSHLIPLEFSQPLVPRRHQYEIGAPPITLPGKQANTTHELVLNTEHAC